jgi:hypothetical protein
MTRSSVAQAEEFFLLGSNASGVTLLAPGHGTALAVYVTIDRAAIDSCFDLKGSTATIREDLVKRHLPAIQKSALAKYAREEWAQKVVNGAQVQYVALGGGRFAA